MVDKDMWPIRNVATRLLQSVSIAALLQAYWLDEIGDLFSTSVTKTKLHL